MTTKSKNASQRQVGADSPSHARFEDRFVAFVDVLGFRDIVKRMHKEPALFDMARDALDSIDKQAEHFEEYRHQKRRGARSALPSVQLQMTAFSDCYVISDTARAWRVVAAVQSLGSALMTQGILSRGAIVHGQSYHHGRVLFGSAIIKASELERDVAKYPRIIVSESVRRAVWKYHTGVWKETLLRRDIDGCWFINVLTPSASSWKALSLAESNESRRKFLNRIRPRLADEVTRQTGEDRLSKWMWLAHWFNREAGEEQGVKPIDVRASSV